MSPKQIRAQFAKQKAQGALQRTKEKAVYAITHYKPKKTDYGKLVMVAIKGGRNPQAKGRKGYLAYVSKGGKVSFVKQSKGNAYSARKITDITIPYQRRFKNKLKQFQAARLEVVGKGRSVIKGSGTLSDFRRGSDFSDSVVTKLTGAVSKALSGQASHRNFLVEVMLLVELPGSEQKVYSFAVPIERPDHIAIQVGGVENWVRKKFYAEMANQLRFDGFITSGSANHIKRITGERVINPSIWDDYNSGQGRTGMNWGKGSLGVVKIITMEYQIKQSK